MYPQDQRHLMLLISHFGDSHYALTVYFPVVFYIKKSTGIHILWVAVISEWLNDICKWLLHGERPYWWIHDSDFYSEEDIPALNQFKITCKTGPGSPSGHAMISAAVWYVLVNHYLHVKDIKSGSGKLLIWLTYWAMLSAVCISRLFIGAHFPHQVLGGVVAGLALAKYLNTISTTSFVMKHYIITVLVLSSAAMAIYFLLLALDIDPLWSLDKALKWCNKKEWVNVKTSLFYSLVKEMSSLLGKILTVELIFYVFVRLVF